MARDVEHVVDPAHDPVVSIVVAAGVVAGEILVRHLAPIDFPVTLVIAPDAAQHAGPGVGDYQPAALVGTHRISLLVDDRRDDSRQRLGTTARLGGNRPGQRAHHYAARLC